MGSMEEKLRNKDNDKILINLFIFLLCNMKKNSIIENIIYHMIYYRKNQTYNLIIINVFFLKKSQIKPKEIIKKSLGIAF